MFDSYPDLKRIIVLHHDDSSDNRPPKYFVQRIRMVLQELSADEENLYVTSGSTKENRVTFADELTVYGCLNQHEKNRNKVKKDREVVQKLDYTPLNSHRALPIRVPLMMGNMDLMFASSIDTTLSQIDFMIQKEVCSTLLIVAGLDAIGFSQGANLSCALPIRSFGSSGDVFIVTRNSIVRIPARDEELNTLKRVWREKETALIKPSKEVGLTPDSEDPPDSRPPWV